MMTEGLEYSRNRFPYYGILEELTEKIKATEMPPTEAYVHFLNARDEHDLRSYFDYCSTSITTGGHALVPDKPMTEIVQANTRTARQMVALMDTQGTLFAKEVVLPVDLGNVGWSQSDYMTYWGLTIAGPEVRELSAQTMGLTNFENRLAANLDEFGVELDVMNDSSVDREDRRPYYDNFVQAFRATLLDTEARCLPAHRLVSLVDPDISLGCWAEKRLADGLDIPSQRVAPVRGTSIDEAVPVPTLREDMKIITALGGTVCVAPQGSILTLVSGVEISPMLHEIEQAD